MSFSDTNDELSFDELADYTFNRVAPEREAEIDRALEDYPEYAEVVDAILDYCEKNEIKDSVSLKIRLAEEQKQFLAAQTSPSLVQTQAKVVPIRKPDYRSRWIVGVAASLLLLLLGGNFLLNRTPATAQLATDWYETYSPDLLRNKMGGAPAKNRPDKPWLRVLENGEVDRLSGVIDHFSALSEEDEEFAAADYYLGIAYFQSERYAESVVSLRRYLGRTLRPVARQRAEFDLGLSLVASGQREEAEEILTAIAENSGHDYQYIVVELLAELQKL